MIANDDGLGDEGLEEGNLEDKESDWSVAIGVLVRFILKSLSISLSSLASLKFPKDEERS